MELFTFSSFVFYSIIIVWFMIASLSHICTVNVFILVFEHVLSPLNYSITLQCRKQLRPIQPEIIKRRLIHDLYERSSLPTTTQQYGLARSRWALAITLFYHYVRSFLPTTRQQHGPARSRWALAIIGCYDHVRSSLPKTKQQYEHWAVKIKVQ